MSAYKDEKHGTWYVKFSYVDWKGNTRWTTKRGFKGKRAAEKYEREFKDKAKSTPDMTVRSLVELYLADAKLHIRESTYILRKRDLMNHVVPSLGDLKLSELRFLTTEVFLEILSTEHMYRKRDGRNSSWCIYPLSGQTKMANTRMPYKGSGTGSARQESTALRRA